jgi:hypothetical protein
MKFFHQSSGCFIYSFFTYHYSTSIILRLSIPLSSIILTAMRPLSPSSRIMYLSPFSLLKYDVNRYSCTLYAGFPLQIFGSDTILSTNFFILHTFLPAYYYINRPKYSFHFFPSTISISYLCPRDNVPVPFFSFSLLY